MPSELDKFRNPIYHFRGASSFPGPYAMKAEALQQYNVTAELFGSTTIIVSDTIQFNVKDYQYALSRDEHGIITEVGMYFIPVSDDASVPDSSGKWVPAGQVIDNFIRNKTQLKETDPIYALISYMHPEENRGTLEQLCGDGMVKTQLGFTHMGAYLGNAITSNSPAAYHNHRFGCAWGGVLNTHYGYPCNIHTVSIKGIDQAVFNQNCQLVDLILGNGIQFPGNYESSMFRPVFINAALMFYRDWLYQETYLFQDTTWYFYCAANKLTVLNIACNLPHNPTAFKEIYGEKEGEALWNQFLLRYTNATGFPFDYYPNQQTDFTPLWKLQGLTPQQIIPFTKEQYDAYDAYRRKGAPYTGPMPVLPPTAVICSPQQTADVINEFIQIYADPYDAGALTTIGVLAAFVKPITQRLGITPLAYLSYTVGLFQKLVYSDARQFAVDPNKPSWDKSTWFQATYTTLVKMFSTGESNQPSPDVVTNLDIAFFQDLVKENPSVEDFVSKNMDKFSSQPALLASFCMLTVVVNWNEIQQSPILTREEAYINFMQSSEGDFLKAEHLVVTSATGIQDNIMPAAFNLISNGLYKANEWVTIETICTAVDIKELQLKESL